MKMSEIRDYRLAAADKGTECAVQVAKLKTLQEYDRETISRAAVAFVNALPLNDLSFEGTLRDIFTGAAHTALKSNLVDSRESPVWSGRL